LKPEEETMANKKDLFAKRLEALERVVQDLRSDVNDLRSREMRLWAGVDLTRQELRLEPVPDDCNSTEPYDARAVLHMKPAALPAVEEPEVAP
jgi:hypothetical protein